jgi:FtsP/CotA-like multicopper oxidase with cupredoxin domain
MIRSNDMTMDDVNFWPASAAATILPSLGAAKYYEHNLVAEPIVTSLVPGYDFKTEMLGFNGSFPGPEIRTQVGQPLKVNVRNNLDEGTAVHWHGIRLPNAMDGVPMLTQDIQEPYTTKSYEFVPPDAGTYWYHSHYNSQEQVARGLIGPLIVEEASQIDVDEDITIILSDWLMNNDGQLIEEFSDMHSVAHAGFMGNYARAIFSTN